MNATAPNEKPDATFAASHRAEESEAFTSEPTAHTEPQPAPPHKPAFPAPGSDAHTLELCALRLGWLALSRQRAASIAHDEARLADAARLELETSALHLAAGYLRDLAETAERTTPAAVGEAPPAGFGVSLPRVVREALEELIAMNETLADAHVEGPWPLIWLAYRHEAAGLRCALAEIEADIRRENSNQLKLLPDMGA